ncbi:hypothetical protein MMC22_003084 [Lobaria immixta]|nr:hypothetical protein [Lobaria immixta]
MFKAWSADAASTFLSLISTSKVPLENQSKLQLLRDNNHETASVPTEFVEALTAPSREPGEKKGHLASLVDLRHRLFLLSEDPW